MLPPETQAKRPKRRPFTLRTKAQIAAAAKIDVADARAWCASLSVTRGAGGRNLKRGLLAAKEMLK